MLQPIATPSPGIDPQFVARLQAIANAPNLATEIDDGVCDDIAKKVLAHFEIDESSMSEWREQMDRALDLASLVREEKTAPWPNASNIKYPLVTSAALQYNARAYPAIVPSNEVVQCAVHGAKTGQKLPRARRVEEFMSYQLKVDTREWERGTDQLTLQLPIIGDVFRKMWWDPAKGRLRSQIRLPGMHIVVNNNATSIQTAPRVSDKIQLYPFQIETNIRSGRFKEFTYNDRTEDDQEPHEFIEQTCRYDLDGDGYDEPIVATVHKETQKCVRIVAAWDMSTIRFQGNKVIEAEPFGLYIHYQFMPSIKGGLLGTGMGLLLGDMSETVNTTLNMIMDSAHLASLGGGFVGAQNFRVKGGVQRVRPGEYKQVNFTGDDIRKGMVNLDFPGPSPVLFQVLGLMIDAAREVASVNDIMTGDSGNANLPVGTVMALIDQGMQVFTASYKRIYRSLLDEYELIAKLNQKHLDPRKYMKFLDEESDPRADFDLSDMDIMPVADPKAVTSMQKMGRAQFLMELSQTGMVDPGAAIKRVLDAANIEDPEELAPKPDPMAQIMAQVQQELLMIEIKQKDADLEKTIAETMSELAKAEKDAAEADLAPMKQRIEMLKTHREMLKANAERIESGRAGRVASQSGN